MVSLSSLGLWRHSRLRLGSWFGSGMFLGSWWKSVKRVSKVVGFLCPHLFLWGFFGCFLEHSIDHLVWCVGFTQLGWILRGRSRLLTWAQATTLTNLPIVKRNTVVVETYPITISPLELTKQHPQLRLSGRHPSQNRPKVGVLILSIGQSILEIIKFLQQSRANITLNQSILRRTRTGFFK